MGAVRADNRRPWEHLGADARGHDRTVAALSCLQEMGFDVRLAPSGVRLVPPADTPCSHELLRDLGVLTVCSPRRRLDQHSCGAAGEGRSPPRHDRPRRGPIAWSRPTWKPVVLSRRRRHLVLRGAASRFTIAPPRARVLACGALRAPRAPSRRRRCGRAEVGKRCHVAKEEGLRCAGGSCAAPRWRGRMLPASASMCTSRKSAFLREFVPNPRRWT